jgi:type III pantothenate kinase
MILLIDIGNSNTTVGFYVSGEIKDTFRLQTNSDRLIDGICGYIEQHKFETPSGASICSVVPEESDQLIEDLKKVFDIDPVVVSNETETGLLFSVDYPQGLGADRIANAVAAHRLYAGDLIVVDSGTATTFCVITADGEYRGGAIMPGPGMSVNALFEKTSKLPKVELSPVRSVIGRSTEDNILSGVVLGHAGAVERIIADIKQELTSAPAVVLTGGYASLIQPYIKVDYINPLLTLEGLRIIHEMNRQINNQT